MGFSGWMLFGCISDLLSGQGVNMLINVFFGPAFNAARGVAMQVYNAIAQFSNNFMVSVNPQIVKGYAKKEFDETYKLVFFSSRLAFFLMFLVGLPVILNAPMLLHYWLGIVPPYAPLFVQLIMIEYIIRSLYSPLATVNQAHGKIRAYQLAISCLLLSNFFISWLLFRLGFPVYTTFIVSAIIAFIGVFTRLYILYRTQDFPLKTYFKKVPGRIIAVIVLSVIPSFIVSAFCAETFPGMLLSCFSDFVFTAVMVWFVGMHKNERHMAEKAIKAKLHLKRS